MSDKIPVTVLVMTRNEEKRITRCLKSLGRFDEIIVVDSGSDDQTVSLAEQVGAAVIDFSWNGAYPKKRQWCLDTLDLKHDWVFFVDADEIVTPELVNDIAALFPVPPHDGYFIRGRYVVKGKIMRFGLCNNKLALFNRHKIHFPVIDDLDLPGMGEIEGHYQPVPYKSGVTMGQLRHFLWHEAYDNEQGWEERHQRYAAWERGMNARNAWPQDPVRWREMLKRFFRRLPGRPAIAFLHSYIVKGGLLDGGAGFRLARDRYRYYKMIS